MAQEIARKPGIGIAFVLDPVQTELAGAGFDLGPGHTKQGAQDAPPVPGPLVTHAGCAGHPAAAQQIEQHGLGLIAAVLGQQQAASCGQMRGKCGITGIASGRFNATTAAAVDDNPGNRQRDALLPAIVMTELRPRVGMRRQSVVHMDRGEPRRPPQTTE